MSGFLKSRLRSIGFALSGWKYVLRTQRNTWVHAVISLGVITLALWLRLSRYEWALLVLIMALVWAAEFFNTALEAFTDLIQPEENPLAKISKDVSAAAVLLTAVAAVVIGLLILGPPLWEKLFK